MKFIDEAEITVQAGNGGSGCTHFRREKFVPYGGPDGGNGGNGGSIIVRADRNKHTLLDFKFKPIWKAENGVAGQGSRKDGKVGADLYIDLPVGTQILNSEDKLIVDLECEGQEFVLAKGGRGGKGNSFFKSAVNRAPDKHQPGEDGEQGVFKLVLKLVADVGLIGFPNAGKSTLISRISNSRPKIADYPFTTLEPNLGVVKGKKRTFVVADIPGLIEGAHTGKGLGIQFLKHVERTGLLVHLIDPLRTDDSGEAVDPITSYESINSEIDAFSDLLSNKNQIAVLTKADAIENIEEYAARFKSKNVQVYCISSVSGLGLPELIQVIEDLLPEKDQ